MESFGAEPFEIVERDDAALSYWEFVHASDAADSDSDSDFGVASFDDVVASLHSSLSESDSLSGSDVQSDVQSLDLASPVESADLANVSVVDSEILEFGGVGLDLARSFEVEYVNAEVKDLGEDRRSVGYEFGWDYAYRRPYEDEDEDEEEEEEYDDDRDLDDELVPWSVNGKLGRQRMRKMGKRGFAKNSSKKAPHTNLKPGCVHGKHVLGVKHNF